MLSVFLVDDEELIREGLKKLIPWEQFGFRISGEASDGEEALEIINYTNADIVITDLKMPFMDGIELSEKLKESLPGIRIIVLTGFDDFALLQQSIRNGVADYLLKPVGREELIESLEKIRKKIGECKYPYPFDAESKILDSISQNNCITLFEQIEVLFEDFSKNKVKLKEVCRILRSVMESVEKLLDSEGINLKYIFEESVTSEEYFLGYDNFLKVEESINKIFNKIMDFKNGKSNGSIINKIKVYIDKNYSQNITLEILASKFYLNPSYVSQLFKNETNQNYSDYLCAIRVEKAIRLLTESSLPIQLISEMVGYPNSKYFSQIFKKYTGKQPSQYR